MSTGVPRVDGFFLFALAECGVGLAINVPHLLAMILAFVRLLRLAYAISIHLLSDITMQ